MACRIPVVVLHGRAEELVEVHAGVRDQIIHYWVEGSVVIVDRLARQVADRVDQPPGHQVTACCSKASRLAPMSQAAKSMTFPWPQS
jgi:hypothetical protein